MTTDQTGNVVAQTRYLPYGEDRWTAGSTPTDFGFTSQRREGFGLYDYQARYYSPALGRFVSPDSIVPEPGSSSGFNRYAYVSNNPLRYIDPTGHESSCAEGDTACWQSDWYRSHGYENVDGDWRYTATFDFENTEFEDYDPREMVQNAAGHWRDVEGLSVIEVMARSSELAAALADNDPALFTEYTVPVFSGHVGTGLQGSIWDFNLTKSADDPTYTYLNLQTDGFAPAYADPDLTNNQAHHPWYWLQVAYYNSTSLAIAGNIKHEVWDVGGRSVQDFNSGMFGIAIGAGLKTGLIRPSNIGGCIRRELGQQVGYSSLVGTLARSR